MNKELRKKRILVGVALIIIAVLFVFALFIYQQKFGQVKSGWEVKRDKADKTRFEIYVDSGEKYANAVQIDLAYNPDEVESIDFDKTNSVCELWIYEKPKIEKPGLSTIACGKPTPGFRGRNFVGNFIFKVKKETSVEIAPSSMILLNDGKGTPLPFQGKKIIIEP